jgi:Tol biopolymer transport system component
MALAQGTRLGPYEVIGTLGSGGMGEVYRARDGRLARDVALKVLPAAFAEDTERMQRFEREAKVLAALNHPNIGAIYGFEESHGVRALVMELVEGPTLADHIAKGAIPIDEALPMAKQIADGLEYAHERGIVHRDLKPANVKITPEGAVKLLDFGLAKALEGDAATIDISSSPTLSHMSTRAGMILGTAAYMSPEQARGKAVDRRTDVWAFGCVLYEMLTGEQAFSGETVTDVLAALVRSEPDWSHMPANVPPSIGRLLQRCVKKDAKQRLQAIGEARIAIEEEMSGAGPDAASPTKAVVASPAPAGQHVVKRMFPWAAAIVFAGLALFFAARYFSGEPKKTSLHFSAVTNFAGVQAQPALSPDGHSIAFVSNRGGHYDIYVGLLNGGNLVQVTDDPSLKSRPVWSRDGSTLAYARLNASGIWDIWVVPALGGSARRILLNAMGPAWSPDGRSLAYENTSDGRIYVSGVSGENPRSVDARPELQVLGASRMWRDSEPRFSPDGKEIAFSARANGPYGELEVADVASGNVRRLTSDQALVLSPAWSPDGRYIYFASSRGGTVNLWKIAAGGGEPEQITAGQGDDAQLDLSSDGTRIVFSTWRMNATLGQVDLAAKNGPQNVKVLTNDPARNQVGPAYSPDGKYLAYFSNLKGAEHESIWVANADGTNPVQLVRDGCVNVFPVWGPDSRNIFYHAEPSAGGQQEFRSVPVSGGAPHMVLNKDAWERFFDVGLDGRLLFRIGDQVAAFDPKLNQTVTLGQIRGELKGAPVRWSPDGRSVAYIVAPTREDDPDAGLWVTDFQNPPRQIFRGWVDWWFARGPNNKIYFLEGKPDLQGALWKVGWDGQGLERTSATIPMAVFYWVTPGRNPQDYFTVSPDGRSVVFEWQTVLQANIGMIANVQ